MDGEEAETWVLPKTSEEEAIERSRQTAVFDTRRWIEEMCEKKCTDQCDFRASLRDGILLCEVLNRLKPGCIKRINRRPTPIAGLDNLSVFLATLERDFGFSKSQLFDVKDLEDLSERYQGDALEKEEETRVLRVAVTLCCLSENFIRRDVSSGAFVTDVSGAVVKPIDSTLFISGTVIHRRQSLALSTDSDSLASGGYLATSSMPVRHNYDSGAGTSLDSLDDSRTSSAASGTVGVGSRFQKRGAADLAREAERQMEVARINRAMASSIRTTDPSDDEWRSNLSDWREKRRRHHQGGGVSFDSVERNDEVEGDSENPKSFKRMVQESNLRRRSFNLLYPVEDEEPTVYNIDIPSSSSTTINNADTEPYSERIVPSSTSFSERPPWAADDPEPVIEPQPTPQLRSSIPSNQPAENVTEKNGIPNRSSQTSESCSSDGEMLQQTAVRQRTTNIRLNRRQGRTELYFGIQLCMKFGSVVVDRVVRGSTADINEVQVGDKVVSVDGHCVSSVAEAKKYLDNNSAQLCVLRSGEEDAEFSDDLSDDDSVELRHSAKPPPSFRRSAPTIGEKKETREKKAISAGPPSDLPLLRQVSSSSSTSLGASQNEGTVASELSKIVDEPGQNTPMINGLLNAAIKGELSVDLKQEEDDKSDEEEMSLTPTANDPQNEGSSAPSLSVKQRISTIESRNSFFGVKADSEEKKYKEIEQTSSRPLSGSGDEESFDKKSHTAQALPWQRKLEFRPIRPRLGNYQKPQTDADPVVKKSPDTAEPPQEIDGSIESEDAVQLMVGMSKMRDDMAKWRQKQETNELEIETVLSKSLSGPSSSSSHRSKDSGDELVTTNPSNVKEKEAIPSAATTGLEDGSSPRNSDILIGPPVRDSRARNAHQQPNDSSSKAAEPSILATALEGHVATVNLEIQKLEQLQYETPKPARTSYESPRQADLSNSSIDTKAQLPEVLGRSESSEGITKSKSYEQEQDDDEAVDSSVLRQPYLQKYLVGEHFKTHQQLEVKQTSPVEKPQPVQNQYVVPKSTPILSSSPPSYAEVRSRNSARNKENFPGERTRPKSLITDQPSAARHSSSSTEIKPSVRTSSSDTQLVSATQLDRAPQNNVPYYQQRYVQEEQVIKPTFKPPQNQAPTVSESDKVKADVMSRSAYEFQSPMQQPFQQEAPMYEKQQQRISNRYQQHSQSTPTAHVDHYNQIYGEQPPIIRYHGQQQISPKNEQYHHSQRSEQQQPRYTGTNTPAYEMAPTMSTSMYDFNRPPIHAGVMTHGDIDDSTVHSNLSRSQTALHPYQSSVVQHQRHTIQRPTQPTTSASRMPNSHSVDSGLFQMRAQNQSAAVSNPVYAGMMVSDAKRAHPHPAQRHWLVDEALRRQQADMDAQRRRNQEQESQRRQQEQEQIQRRKQVEMEAQRRQAEMEAQRRQHELEAQRRQQAELDPQRRQKADMRKGHSQMIPQKQQLPPRENQSSVEIPPALPPRMRSSAAIAAMQRPRPVLNSRAPCCACNQALGTGDLMTIESLHLSFHLTCFRCIVCQTMLGSGRQDADVRVRGSRLYCFNCSALEEGTGGGSNLSRRGGGRY